MKLSETHLDYLKMFKPDTYGVSLPYSIAKTLEIKGLVEWMPPQFGTQMWAITEKGKRAVAESQSASRTMTDDPLPSAPPS